jgi:hypothetical protein
MLNRRFWTLIALVFALFGAGCASTQATPVTSAAPAASGIPAASPAAVLPPQPIAVSPSMAVAACTSGYLSGGIDYLSALDSARRMDGEELGKPLALEARNAGWKTQQRSIADATTVKDCSENARKLAGLLGRRYTQAQTLCDLRPGSGGGAAFKELTGSQHEALITTLRDALKKTKLDECKKTAASVESELLQLVDEANAQCSPREDDQKVSCSATLARHCATGTEPPDVVSSCLPYVSPGRRAVSERSLAEPSAEARGVVGAGGLESAILTGAADFFVERAEQELSLFAVEVVGKELCSETSKVKPFLPKTCDLLGPPPKGESAGTLGPTAGAIRAAAKADLEALPASVVAKIHEKDQNLGCAAAFGWSVADEVAHGSELVSLLKDPTPLLAKELIDKNCPDGAKQDIANLAKYLQQILSGDQGLLARELRAGHFDRLVTMNSKLSPAPRAAAPGLAAPDPILKEVLRRLVELDRAISAYHADPTPAKRVLMVVAAIQTVEPILNHLARDSKYQSDIRTSIDLFTQILNHQYAEAVVTVSSFKVVMLLPVNARNLLSLSAGLAQAESSEDVKKTLQDAALPLGSWRRKNVPRFGITLTGFVGGNAGYEFVTERPQDDIKVSNGWAVAPTLLVGADMHYGLGGSRLGLHLNILDLGALATNRLEQPTSTNETTNMPAGSVDQHADVRVEQVFAPGLFGYFGWGPFAVGPMGSFVPSLRPYKEANGEISPLSVFRFGAVLAVDVSVLPLF